jgi:hypothetical protein
MTCVQGKFLLSSYLPYCCLTSCSVSPIFPNVLGISVSFLMYDRFLFPLAQQATNCVHSYFLLINMNVGHKYRYVYSLQWYLCGFLHIPVYSWKITFWRYEKNKIKTTVNYNIYWCQFNVHNYVTCQCNYQLLTNWYLSLRENGKIVVPSVPYLL